MRKNLIFFTHYDRVLAQVEVNHLQVSFLHKSYVRGIKKKNEIQKKNECRLTSGSVIS